MELIRAFLSVVRCGLFHRKSYVWTERGPNKDFECGKCDMAGSLEDWH